MNAAMLPPGDFVVVLHASRWSPPAALLDAARWPAAADGGPLCRATPADGVTVVWRGAISIAAAGRGAIAVFREPPAAPAPPAAAAIAAAGRDWSPGSLRGAFCAVAWDAPAGTLAAWVDPFRARPLYHASPPGAAAVATDLRLLRLAGLVDRAVSAPALYHYLNFSYVPAPLAAFAAAAKLPAGHRLDAGPGRARVARWWTLDYSEDLRDPPDALAAALRGAIVGTVRDHRPDDATRWGTFLSGGTDSSSISGILAGQHPERRVEAFSIGFEEAGYDELAYSRIARAHYRLGGAERRVGERDAVAVLPTLVASFDEPFGNPSAIPTHWCATMAREAGVRWLIAGDGGDEIFGGNERYRKDRILQAWYRAPRALRAVGALAAAALGRFDGRLANRVRNFHARGSIPNPDRFYSDDSFASDCFETLLEPAFAAQVGRNDSLALQREVYRSAHAHSELNRLMWVDLMMTIADNDLVKVVRASRAAGVEVDFPYLDRGLVEYTARIPAALKLRGLTKRWLFRQAMDEVLPEAIRRKRKQGFGLPVAVWIRRPGPFRELMLDVLHSRSARERALLRTGQVDALLERHTRGAWDHASELYLLLMLELWHREQVDAG
jgi:asparagine synthase (glutamine-hydrolysing)